jgi:predicted transcriptional regulator
MEVNMNETDQTEQLLTFFKALSDVNRLKIVGLLSQQELSVEQLAEMLGVRSSTISHHLSTLVKAGLVSARPESYYNVYRFENETLENMSRRLLASDTLPAVAADVDVDAYDKKVIQNYSNPDGSLKALPVQRKKLMVILNHIMKSFEKDRRYNEKEINEILERFHEDFVSLRRDLVDTGMLGRDKNGAEYWVTAQD